MMLFLLYIYIYFVNMICIHQKQFQYLLCTRNVIDDVIIEWIQSIVVQNVLFHSVVCSVIMRNGGCQDPSQECVGRKRT